MEWANIVAVLQWIISGGGASLSAYWLIEHIAKLAALRAEAKRYAAFALAAGIGVGAWALLGWMAGVAWPSMPQEWVSTMFEVAALSILGSQVVHGRERLASRNS